MALGYEQIKKLKKAVKQILIICLTALVKLFNTLLNFKNYLYIYLFYCECPAAFKDSEPSFPSSTN